MFSLLSNLSVNAVVRVVGLLAVNGLLIHELWGIFRDGDSDMDGTEMAHIGSDDMEDND